MPRGKPSATRAVVAERRRKAIEMRHSGVDAVVIGYELGYGRWTPSADLPLDERQPVSSDSSIARIVRQDISRGLDDRRTDLVTAADELRMQQTERLEMLRVAHWPKAIELDPVSTSAVLRIEERIAKLWGLDKPVRIAVDHSVAAAEVQAAVVELVQLVDQSVRAEGAPHRLALEA